MGHQVIWINTFNHGIVMYIVHLSTRLVIAIAIVVILDGCAYCFIGSCPLLILYSRYNLQGAIFMNHQISHLAIFAILKFANHSTCCFTFCIARFIVSWKLKWIHSQLIMNQLLGDTTFTRRCGQV